LSNEVTRRLANISNNMCQDERVAVLDDFTIMLGGSGHSVKAVSLFLVNWINQSGGRRAAASGAPMRRKNLTSKIGWFRQGKKDDYNCSVVFQTPMAKQVTARPVRAVVLSMRGLGDT
jgi:hypothetical protein